MFTHADANRILPKDAVCQEFCLLQLPVRPEPVVLVVSDNIKL